MLSPHPISSITKMYLEFVLVSPPLLLPSFKSPPSLIQTTAIGLTSSRFSRTTYNPHISHSNLLSRWSDDGTSGLKTLQWLPTHFTKIQKSCLLLLQNLMTWSLPNSRTPFPITTLRSLCCRTSGSPSSFLSQDLCICCFFIRKLCPQIFMQVTLPCHSGLSLNVSYLLRETNSLSIASNTLFCLEYYNYLEWFFPCT